MAIYDNDFGTAHLVFHGLLAAVLKDFGCVLMPESFEAEGSTKQIQPGPHGSIYIKSISVVGEVRGTIDKPNILAGTANGFGYTLRIDNTEQSGSWLFNLKILKKKDG